MYDIVKDKKVLRAIAKPVSAFPASELVKAIKALTEAYLEKPGCQMLHAKQLGYDMELAICKTGRSTFEVLTNLSLLKDGSTYMSNEGSYSVIGRYLVRRYKKVTASYDKYELAEDETVTVTAVRNREVKDVNVARVLQHCRDLCDGKLLSDKGKFVSIVDPAKKGKFKEW